ncbi:MAG: hypothetical protein L0H64_16405, partial [Pseudonocardia sp.]|nr:hypothetical protein [Pseudonocardia sp.]
MNTLVALGAGVAYVYSAFVTLWPAAAERWGLPLHVYFETSLVIVALVLLVVARRRAHHGRTGPDCCPTTDPAQPADPKDD